MSRRPSGGLLLETFVMLLVASLAIRITPFARLAGLMRKRANGSKTAPASFAAELRRALEAWNRRLPWRTLCFEQGLAAHWILNHSGYASTLYYGASMAGGELNAHVWVRSGELDVIGCENSADFAILSQFSNVRSSSSVHS